MAIDPSFVQGVLKIMDVFLAVVAGVLCIQLLNLKKKWSSPWTFMAIALLIFAFGEVMGTLDAFGVIFFKPFLPGIELGVLVFFAIALLIKRKEVAA